MLFRSEKLSSANQFYIVTGKTFTKGELNNVEIKNKEYYLEKEIKSILADNQALAKRLETSDDIDNIQTLMDSLRTVSETNLTAKGITWNIPQEIRDVYMTEGGTPWLDNQYTVFGEVIDGFDVLDKIQNAETDSRDRPIKDIKMEVSIIK